MVAIDCDCHDLYPCLGFDQNGRKSVDEDEVEESKRLKDNKTKRLRVLNYKHTISNYVLGTEECLGKWDLYGPDAEVL